jgi:hypothetical protein
VQLKNKGAEAKNTQKGKQGLGDDLDVTQEEDSGMTLGFLL